MNAGHLIVAFLLLVLVLIIIKWISSEIKIRQRSKAGRIAKVSHSSSNITHLMVARASVGRWSWGFVIESPGPKPAYRS